MVLCDFKEFGYHIGNCVATYGSATCMYELVMFIPVIVHLCIVLTLVLVKCFTHVNMNYIILQTAIPVLLSTANNHAMYA